MRAALKIGRRIERDRMRLEPASAQLRKSSLKA